MVRGIYRDIRRSLVTGALAFACMTAGIDMVCAAEDVYTLSIPAGSAADALDRLAEQTGLSLLYPADELLSVQSNALDGSYSLLEALDVLTKDTRLNAVVTEKRVIVVSVTPEAQQDSSKGERQMKKTSSFFAGIASLLASAIVTPDVAGQEGGTGAMNARQGKSVIEEITVTAQKRGAQAINEVPMSISAFTDEDINERGFVGMDSYLPSQPGVAYIDRSAGQNSIIIRGLSADPQFEKSMVGMYIGELPVTGLGAMGRGNPDIKLVDIERIELLRGPQGTLYGDGSMGGTVRVIPKQPVLDSFEGELGTSYSGTDHSDDGSYMFQGVLNVPVVKDKFAVRVVGYTFDNGGFIDNIAGSNPDKLAVRNTFGAVTPLEDDIAEDNYTGGRIMALWRPTDRLELKFSYMVQDIDQKGTPETSLPLGNFVQTRFERPGGDDERFRSDFDLFNFDASYELDLLTVESSTSWGTVEAARDFDIGTFVGAIVGLPDIPIWQRDTSEHDILIQELRVSSTFSGPLQLLAGVYYQEITTTDNLFVDWVGDDPALDIFGNALLLDSRGKFKTDQLAFFGEASYAITDKLTATAGVRYFEYDQSRRETSDGVFSGGFMQTSLDNKEDGTTFRVNLSYQHDENALLFAQFAEGFRLGGPHETIAAGACDLNGDGLLDGVNIPQPERVGSDSIESWELGSKLTLLDGRLQLNGSAFYIDWSGIPISASLACGFILTLNAGSAESMGVEFDGKFAFTERLNLDYRASYVDAELTSDVPPLGADGERLPGTPQFTAGVGLRYDFNLGGYDSFLRGDLAYVGDYFSTPQETAPKLGDYVTINARLGIMANNVGIDLFVNNLTDEYAVLWASTNIPDGRANVLRPRTYGVELRYRF